VPTMRLMRVSPGDARMLAPSAPPPPPGLGVTNIPSSNPPPTNLRACVEGAFKSIATKHACVCATGSVCTPASRDASVGCVGSNSHQCVEHSDDNSIYTIPIELWIVAGSCALLIFGMLLGCVIHGKHRQGACVEPPPEYVHAVPGYSFPQQQTYTFV